MKDYKQPQCKIEYFNEQLKKRDDIGKVSDGYHTFKELYDHRIILFLSLVDMYLDEALVDAVWSDTHHDGEKLDGWLIVSVDLGLDFGQVSYHMPEDYRYILEASHIDFVDKAPKWDGHTSEDVLNKLVTFNFGLKRRV